MIAVAVITCRHKNTDNGNGTDLDRSVIHGTRINALPTDEQIAFINSHFDNVLTAALSAEVREKIQGPQLWLYRSMRSGWPTYHDFNWAHIDSNENMFCHDTSPENPHPNNRILTIYDSWLMDRRDLVDPDSSDTLNHWINYYAITVSKQINDFGYDGLFIDEADPRLWSDLVYGLMPDDYTDESWRDATYAALEFIKSYLPNKLVVFNGLGAAEYGAEHSLTFTDGGMWELFAFNPTYDIYLGEKNWQDAIELFERNNDDKLISIVSKKVHLTTDIQTRIFILASYLLVSNQNVSLGMVDFDYGPSGELLYYPEYDLRIGNPLDDYTVGDNGIYERQFEGGCAVVNPSGTQSRTYMLDKEYYKVVPNGGGLIQEDGTCDGSLDYEYETVKNEVELPPISGMILMNK